MTMHRGLVDQASKFKKRVASEDVSTYKVIKRGELVVGFPIDEGVLDFQDLYAAAIVSPAYGVWKLRDTDKVDPNYLQKFLRSEPALSYYRAKLRGSTARRRSLPSELFLALPVPLPTADEQRRIATILDHADALRAKRRQVLAHLDALTQSTFYDMFGDTPGSTPLGQLLTHIETGVSPKCEARPADADEVGVLKLGAVTYGDFRPSENKAFTGDLGILKGTEVRRGDVLMTRKNTPELVGAVALVGNVRAGLHLPDLVFRLTLDESQVTGEYLQAQMMSRTTRARVRALAGGSAQSMSNISMARLRGLGIAAPPMERQTEFGNRVQAIRALREKVLADVRAMDELFASLQSRAFRGEL